MRRAGDLGIRARADDRSDLGLHMALDHGLRGPAALFAPNERYLGAELNVDIDDREAGTGDRGPGKRLAQALVPARACP